MLSSAKTFDKKTNKNKTTIFAFLVVIHIDFRSLEFYYFPHLNCVHFDATAVAAAARVFVYIFIREILLHISTYWLHWSEFLNHRNWIWSQHERRKKKANQTYNKTNKRFDKWEKRTDVSNIEGTKQMKIMRKNAKICNLFEVFVVFFFIKCIIFFFFCIFSL